MRFKRLWLSIVLVQLEETLLQLSFISSFVVYQEAKTS